MNNLDQSIIRTVAWFSMFDYAPTGFEIWKWLLDADRSYNLDEVISSLDKKDFLETYNGYYSLRGGVPLVDLIALRQERYLDAWRKFRRLRRVVKFFGLLPGVRAVAAVNTLAWSHTREESDIDMFIITRPGTIWSTRLLLVLPFALLRLRPGKGRRDPLCFSFFATSEAFDFSKLRIDGGDPYLAMWILSLVPIFDRDDLFKTFINQNNWVTENLCHTMPRQPSPKLMVKPFPSLIPQLSWFERLAKLVQMKHLPAKLKNQANQSSDVIINDSMLKFHDQDRREEYRSRWKNICQKYEA